MYSGSNTLSRRSLLVGLAGIAATACAGRGPAAPARKVVVVGAGLAGLAAAYELGQAGFDVVVAEQALRAGGRIHTVRDYFDDGAPIELGGVVIASNYGLFRRYCGEFGLDLGDAPRPAVRADMTLHSSGELHSLAALRRSGRWPFELSQEEAAVAPLGLLNLYLMPTAREIGTIDRVLHPTFAEYDGMSLRQFLDMQGASRAAIGLIDKTLNYNSVDTVSALSVLRDLVRRVQARSATLLKLAGGNSMLPEAFARRLSSSIRFGTSLRGISEADGQTWLAMRTPSGDENWNADYVVITIPFTALRDVSLEGALANEKQRMINELPYTQVVRTYMQTSTRFWETGADPVSAIVTDGPLERFFNMSDDMPGTKGLLQNWINGIGTERVSGMDSTDRVRFIRAQMSSIWSGDDIDIEKTLSVDWGQTYCRGAYAHFAPGQVAKFAQEIARPVGRVHFAGEHTEFAAPGMDGALVSGNRAAQEVIDSVTAQTQ